MKILKNSFDKELKIDTLAEAKKYYTSANNAELVVEIEGAETLKELADILNSNSEYFGGGIWFVDFLPWYVLENDPDWGNGSFDLKVMQGQAIEAGCNVLVLDCKEELGEYLEAGVVGMWAYDTELEVWTALDSCGEYFGSLPEWANK